MGGVNYSMLLVKGLNYMVLSRKAEIARSSSKKEIRKDQS